MKHEDIPPRSEIFHGRQQWLHRTHTPTFTECSRKKDTHSSDGQSCTVVRKFATRTSTGLNPSVVAMLSMTVSMAKMLCGTPGARMDVFALKFVFNTYP